MLAVMMDEKQSGPTPIRVNTINSTIVVVGAFRSDMAAEMSVYNLKKNIVRSVWCSRVSGESMCTCQYE